MKKILAILLAISLSTILLASCGESTSEISSVSPSKTDSETASETASEEPDDLIMPDVVGQDYRLAQSTLEDIYGVIVDISFFYNDTVDSNVVIGTAPAAGTNLTKGQTVTVTASRGASVQVITVPNFLDMNIDEAQAKAEEMGLVAQHVLEMQDSRTKGTVIYQSPTADALAHEGDTIVFYVSTGQTATTSTESSEVNTGGTDIAEVPEESIETPAVAVGVPSEAYTAENSAEENTETTYTRTIFVPIDKIDKYRSRGTVLVTITVGGATQINTYADTSVGTFTATISGRGVQDVTVMIDGKILSSMYIEFS